jgi:nicotinate-nucleotide pyrophosphorylase (carboxylating)
MHLNDLNILKLIDLAIDEDIKTGDVTTNLIISHNETREAAFIVKQKGIIAGLEVAKMVVKKFDPDATWTLNKKDGDVCLKGDITAVVKGNYRALLSSERTALNFVQRMSGIATKTNKFVKQLEGLNTKILDTRKTVPGHRVLDKYAVRMGGGINHRAGLYDMVLIKDNHIKLAGDIKSAVNMVRENIHKSMKIEVEASTISEVKEALEAGVDIIMFDNMNVDEMNEAAIKCKGKVLTEASGNVSIHNVRKIAETGVDYISVGELTHSVEALDISMKIID